MAREEMPTAAMGAREARAKGENLTIDHDGIDLKIVLLLDRTDLVGARELQIDEPEILHRHMLEPANREHTFGMIADQITYLDVAHSRIELARIAFLVIEVDHA
jgi:hypothetical protein